ncbi:MAG: hypothetical protein QME94_15520, partial [Anaerolineae bacterium]|nr:hypothetical protein [Anaerolineae bacterium]
MQPQDVLFRGYWKAAVAVLPGLWLAWQGAAAVGWWPQGLPAAVLAIVATAAIGAGLLLERRLALWSLPSVGALLWALAAWGQWLVVGVRHGLGGLLFAALVLLWVPLAVGAILIIVVCAYAVCRECSHRRIYLPGALLVLLATVMLGWSCAQYAWYLEFSHVGGAAPSARYLAGLVGHTLFWAAGGGLWTALGFLGTLALGLLLARRHGAAAGVLVVSCLPAWLDAFTMFFRPIRAKHYELAAAGLAGQLQAMTTVLAVGCLVLPVLGALVGRSERTRRCWFVLPPLLALVSVCVLQSHAQQRLGLAYGRTGALMDALVVAAFWLPALIAATLYS